MTSEGRNNPLDDIDVGGGEAGVVFRMIRDEVGEQEAALPLTC